MTIARKYLKFTILTALFFVVFTIGFNIGNRNNPPEYKPDRIFFEIMKQKTSATGFCDDVYGCHAQVGKTYEEGDAAYFTGDEYNYEISLERWYKTKENFLVIRTVFQPQLAFSWITILTYDGTLVDSTPTQNLDIKDPIITEMSRYTQKLLMQK